MENDLKTLQLFYASVLADSVYNYSEFGILSPVTENKRKRQAFTASAQIKQLNAKKPKELFQLFSRVFGCIQWQISEDKGDCVARGNKCLLCQIAKSMNTAQPCFIYCINPYRELLKAMTPSYKLEVKQTLWDKDACIFKVSAIDGK